MRYCKTKIVAMPIPSTDDVAQIKAEKVMEEIGRIIGATKVRNGYMEGNGYMVTWTFGNMLSLAMPKDYGTQKLERNDFPFIPSEFELMVRHTRTENGWIPDIDAVLQLKVIERVFQACDTIIAATDASRDGEMTFRYVYQYLNCTCLLYTSPSPRDCS